jgi:hypothetical protein
MKAGGFEHARNFGLIQERGGNLTVPPVSDGNRIPDDAIMNIR